jgi:glucosamine--fructose-6-phosphate aminotransferase (isomerizing)
MPSRDTPLPGWLLEETAKTPLWYIIREAGDVPTAHPYLLHNEIHKQPSQWDDIVANCQSMVDTVAAQLHEWGIRQVITTGCGSAFFTAIHGEFTIPRLSGLPATAVESFELANYFPRVDLESTLVIAHSGTGGSIETIQALEAATARGTKTLAITNTDGSNVVRAADVALTYETRQECGPCTSVVSTRILLQTMLAAALGRQSSSGDDDLADPSDALRRIASVGNSFLERDEPAVRDIAERYREAASWLLIGSGPNYFSAREGTLKIEEQAILIGKAYRTGDFHHDALSLVAPERVVVAIEADGQVNDRVVDAVRAAKEGGSPTIAVTWTDSSGARELAATCDHTIRLDPGLPELVVPIPMTLVFQLLGYYLGVARGFNPDTLRTDHEPNTRAWLTSFPLGTH